MKRLASILFWSVIAAAFVGPGTVTTCAAAGSRFGLTLLWALSFSVVACFLLQEAAARVTLFAGKDLGEALRSRYPHGLKGMSVLVLVVGAIIVGCAAYEAGNIVGAVAGISLLTSWPNWITTAALSLLAVLALWNRPPRTVARILSVLVALMGVAFLWTAVALHPPVTDLLRGAFVPTRPGGSGLLVLALVGTTVVPYNLFLGSGIAAGQDAGEMRFGLAVAIGVGGLISMGILVAGMTVAGEFNFPALADVLAQRLGLWARVLFAIGLAAAGLSSAITAPLAAAVTARGLFSRPGGQRWTPRDGRFRMTWLSVVLVGLGFGLSGVKPVPVILLAQALNGILLPVAAIFLLLTVNDRRLLGDDGVNSAAANLALGVVVLVSVLLGSGGVLRAIHGALALGPTSTRELLLVSALVVVTLCVPIVRSLSAARSSPPARN
jgi:manganese transport protein